MSFFRYPGGKAKLRHVLLKCFEPYSSETGIEYREPFFGGGSVGTVFVDNFPSWGNYWINDKDFGVAALWTSLIRHPDGLKARVMDFVPHIDRFDEYRYKLTYPKSIDLENESVCVDFGFMKLAIHQISYSGLGTKSGGPLGGRQQKSQYKVDCRWSPEYICKKIDKLHEKFSRLAIRENRATCMDFEQVIREPGPAILYLDPPYYEKGGDLYQFAFTKSDHQRMAMALHEIENPWVVSYDDCEEVRSLYTWARVFSIDVNYSITALKDKETGKRLSRSKSELIIFSPNFHEGDIDGNLA